MTIETKTAPTPSAMSSKDAWPLSLAFALLLGKLLASWRFIAVGTVVGTLLSGAAIFSIPKTYEASSTMIISGGSDITGGILSALATKDISNFLGNSSGNSSQMLLLSLLGSRPLAFEMIQRHDLKKVWKLTENPPRWELPLRTWRKAFAFEVDENDNLALSFKAHDPRLASLVLEDVANWIDSAYQENQRLKARASASFIGERLEERRKLLWSAEDSLVAFQRRTGSILPAEQLKLTAEVAARQEAHLEELKIQQRLATSFMGENSSESRRLQELVQQVQNSNTKLWSNSDRGNKILKGMGKNLEAGIRFERLRRDVMMHGQVYAFLMQQYEQFGIEASRDIPVLSGLDSPLVPTLKKSPPRMALLLLAFLMSFSGCCAWILLRRSLRDFNDQLRAAIRSER